MYYAIMNKKCWAEYLNAKNNRNSIVNKTS